MNIKQFIAQQRIAMTAEWADRNPNIESDGNWAASHYRCKLTRADGDQRRALTVFYSMGAAHTREPKAAEVLDCLASDASGYEQARTFEEWCGEYGYDTDSRKAERTYTVIGKQARKLRKFLGANEYEKLLYETERE